MTIVNQRKHLCPRCHDSSGLDIAITDDAIAWCPQQHVLALAAQCIRRITLLLSRILLGLDTGCIATLDLIGEHLKSGLAGHIFLLNRIKRILRDSANREKILIALVLAFFELIGILRLDVVGIIGHRGLARISCSRPRCSRILIDGDIEIARILHHEHLPGLDFIAKIHADFRHAPSIFGC